MFQSPLILMSWLIKLINIYKVSYQNAINDEQVELLLADVLEKYGYDFTGYSKASLKRRILRLFALNKQVSFAEFRYNIGRDGSYFKRFVEQITVNVTEMFRDPAF